VSDELSDSAAGTRQMRDRFTFLLIVTATFGLQLLTLVTGIIMARLLGVEGRGLIALVVAVGLFASQISLGGSLPSAVTKLVAERRITARDGLRDVARRRGWFVLVPCLLAGALTPALHHSGGTSDTVAAAVVVAVVTFQTIAFQVLAGCLQGEGRLVRMAWVALAPQGMFTIVLVVVLVAGWSWDAYAVLAAYIVTGLVSVGFAYRSMLPARGRPDDAIDESLVWAEARGNYVSSVRPIDGLGLERILVGGLLGTASLGLFATALAVSNLCRLVSNAVRVIVLPRVATHQDDPVAQRAVVRRWVGITVLLATVIVIVLEIVVEPVIRLAFGQEFVGAVDCARWLIVADGLLAVRSVLIAVMQGQGRGSTASWIELALVPVMLVGIVVAAHHDSLVGVGMTLAAVGLLSCVALGRAVGRGPGTVGRHARGRGRGAAVG
jgi:O-antigen/teichoic acid export membrane protein